jgi:RNA ligase
MFELRKYVRTPHLVGSRLQVGDTADGQVSVAALVSGTQVWEEKVDGSNVAISFSADADLLLQSRGHYLTGGWREKQYNLFKRWANRHLDFLFDVLGSRYIMYGEWCFAKHTVFYDRLPHYFLEFDVYDRQQDCFLATAERAHLLQERDDSPIVSVPVVHCGRIKTETEIRRLIQPSLYKSDTWQTVMHAVAASHGIDAEQAASETDQSSLCEGLYLKVEDAGKVIGRYKFVRPDFLQAILDSGSHWATRTILPNQLAPGVDIFS